MVKRVFFVLSGAAFAAVLGADLAVIEDDFFSAATFAAAGLAIAFLVTVLAFVATGLETVATGLDAALRAVLTAGLSVFAAVFVASIFAATLADDFAKTELATFSSAVFVTVFLIDAALVVAIRLSLSDGASEAMRLKK